MSQHVEIETKFSVSESTPVPNLDAIDGFTYVERQEVHHLSATYFDTEDLRLTRSKITLRRRTGGNDAGWHIKLPGVLGRKEIQAPLNDDQKNNPYTDTDLTPPRELLGNVRALTQGRPLIPIAQVDNERHVSYLADDLANIVAEFCDDHVSTISFLPGGFRKQWREWEFEIANDQLAEEEVLALLESAHDVLTAGGAIASKSPSKLVSALDDSIDNAPPLPRVAQLPKGEPARGVLNALANNAAKIVHYDPLVRANKYDSVHQMRVATRELRSHMQTFEGILGGEQYLHIENELKTLATILGKARDAEVIEERLQQLLDSEFAEACDEQTKTELLNDIHAEYRRAHKRVVRALDDDRYTNLLQALEDLLSNPPLIQNDELNSADNTDSAKSESPTPVSPIDASQVLLNHLEKAFDHLIKLEKKARKQWNDPTVGIATREENFHKVRKAAKKLRYSAEAVGKATPHNTKKLYSTCRTLQSILGDYQDAITTRDKLHRRAINAHKQGKDTFLYGVLYQHEHSLSRHYLNNYAEAFKSIKKAHAQLIKKASKKKPKK